MTNVNGTLKLIDYLGNKINEVPFSGWGTYGALFEVRPENQLSKEDLNIYGPSIQVRITGVKSTL